MICFTYLLLHIHAQNYCFPVKVAYDHVFYVTEGLLEEREESLTQATVSLAEIALLFSSIKNVRDTARGSKRTLCLIQITAKNNKLWQVEWSHLP